MKTIYAVVGLSLALCSATVTRADIFEWEYINAGDPGQGKRQSSTLVPDGEGVDAVPYADLSSRNLTMAYLIGTNLTNAGFFFATLTNADLTGADLRGAPATGFSRAVLDGAVVTNLIGPNGVLDGLNLSGGQVLLVRDYDGNPDAMPTPTGPIPVTVQQQFIMGTGGILQLRFEADPWDSTISFEPGISVSLEGTLSLDFASDVELASQIGRTLDLFDWTGVVPIGVFTVESPYIWDLSDLYSTGEVIFVAVPEPPTAILLVLGMIAVLANRRTVVSKLNCA